MGMEFGIRDEKGIDLLELRRKGSPLGVVAQAARPIVLLPSLSLLLVVEYFQFVLRRYMTKNRAMENTATKTTNFQINGYPNTLRHFFYENFCYDKTS